MLVRHLSRKSKSDGEKLALERQQASSFIYEYPFRGSVSIEVLPSQLEERSKAITFANKNRMHTRQKSEFPTDEAIASGGEYSLHVMPEVQRLPKQMPVVAPKDEGPNHLAQAPQSKTSVF